MFFVLRFGSAGVCVRSSTANHSLESGIEEGRKFTFEKDQEGFVARATALLETKKGQELSWPFDSMGSFVEA